jgi:hypothetical protein
VIHSEETDAAYQHFYPLSLLAQHKRQLSEAFPVPALSARVTPAHTQTKYFVYPRLSRFAGAVAEDEEEDLEERGMGVDGDLVDGEINEEAGEEMGESAPVTVLVTHTGLNLVVTSSTSTPPALSSNPFPSPTWLPESAHFVRQWWPTLPGVPRVSCTVILLADHDPETHQTRFAFAQHYFTVPFNSINHDRHDHDHVDRGSAADPSSNNDGEYTAVASRTRTPAPTHRYQPLENDMMKMWYVSTPFDVVYVNDNTDDDAHDRSRPLVAVDFGHAVWVEHGDVALNNHHNDSDSRDEYAEDAKCLRFVTFPPIGEDDSGAGTGGGGAVGADGDGGGQEGTMMEGVVRTLEVPDELDLDTVETINIDQSQGAVILSSSEGKIYFLFYT